MIGEKTDCGIILSRVGTWTLRRLDFPNEPEREPYYSFGTDAQYAGYWGIPTYQGGTLEEVMNTLSRYLLLDKECGEAFHAEVTFMTVLQDERKRVLQGLGSGGMEREQY